MLPEFTPAVARALEAAERWACRFGTPSVEPTHLLLGLLDEEEGRAAMLLAQVGVEPAAVRRALAPDLTEIPVPPTVDPLPLSSTVHQALRNAGPLTEGPTIDQALAGDQVLLALLTSDAPLRQQLEALGLAFPRLEAEAVAGRGAPLPLDEALSLPEPLEQINTARVLDASANRAREGLRVIEDYCRFALDDPFLSGECKQIRHELAASLTVVPAGLLLEARETLRDVGTALTTSREQRRESPLAVAQANLKRLQEALRSLEEFGKLYGPNLGQALERLRYRSYTLERALVLGTTARQRLAEARLYVLVSGSGCTAALDWTIQEALAGGAQIIQLREKELPDRTLLERARLVRRLTRQAGALFIMNDRPDLARLAAADGVHVGQDELPVMEARRIMGPDALIGVSTHNLEQVRQAILDGASYLGVGPTFPSGTKHFAEFPGLDFVRRATAETSLPAFVIGGVTLNTIGAAVAAGARRVAVSQAICQADAPRRAAVELLRLLGP